METKMIQVPFDIELAKKITSGDILGKVVTRDGKNTRIVCFDKKNPDYPIVGLVIRENIEVSASFTSEGIYSKGCSGKNDLMLEIPEYMTFKDGDVIAFGVVAIFIGIYRGVGVSVDTHSDYVVLTHEDMLRFDGNAWTLINSRKATEDEKQKLIEALKSSKEPKAKEYMRRFFGIENSPKVSNSEKFGKKEELAQAYTDMEVKRYHEHSGVIEKYGMERARMTSEHESWELTDAYKSRWDTCLKHLASIPWDEAMNEIVNYCKGKEN